MQLKKTNKKTKKIGHHAEPKWASATAPLRTGLTGLPPVLNEMVACRCVLGFRNRDLQKEGSAFMAFSDHCTDHWAECMCPHTATALGSILIADAGRWTCW